MTNRTAAMWGGLLCLGALACSSTSFDGALYRGDGFAFRVPPKPSSWERLDATPAALAYRDEDTHAMVMINARCGLDGDDVPLQALTHHLLLQFTERHIVTQETVPFDGREAMHTRLDAKLDGVAMRYDFWVMKKDGCVYDLAYFAPPSTFESGYASFQTLVQGFNTVDGDGN